MAHKRVLLFGATGALGSAISQTFLNHGWDVVPVVRVDSGLPNEIVLPFRSASPFEGSTFNTVIFAQGSNVNGTIQTTSNEALTALFEANVGFIVKKVKFLLHEHAIAKNGRIVIISSIAELFTRKEKLAYTISKAAVGGLVRSLAVDLGKSHGILVNGILPGVVDSPMTRNNLVQEQFDHLVESTPMGRLVTPADVANSVYLLGSELNTAISGQSLLVDNAHSITYLP